MNETERVYEQLLVTLVQSGDRRAGERLAARWQPRLLRTATRLLQDPDLAREAVQDAWAGIFRGCEQLSDPERFPAWAFGILHRKCADLIRRRVRQRARELPMEQGPAPSALRADDDRLALEQALARLSLDHRAAALLHLVEGLTLAEVANALRVPVGTAKSRLFHARRHLMAALEGDCDD